MFIDPALIQFDGADALLDAWRQGVQPDPTLTVSEWADANRWISTRSSAEPGRYRTRRTPYMREIMDCLSISSPVERVVFMKSAQVGATEAGNNWIGYVIDHGAGPMLNVLPTVDLAKRNSRQRIDTLIEDSPSLRSLVKPARARDSGNTMLSKEFPGGILVLTGANSAVGLRSMPARFLFMDEIDAFPPSVDEEGDPVALAEARAMTFGHRKKVFLASTPTIQGVSRIENEYEASDQRRYFVPCPHCGYSQHLIFERLKWDRGQPETAAYFCESCDGAIYEQHKTAMLEAGEWRATAECSNQAVRGYHINALYSPVGWLSWERIAASWDTALGHDDRLRVFTNTILGKTWVERGEAPEWKTLYDRRAAWPSGQVPEGAAILTAGVDVQGNRLEADVWAWGPGLESWLIDHVVIEGGAGKPEAWAELSALLDRRWEHEAGGEARIERLAIDTGFETQAVYAWAREAGFDRVVPVKGNDRFDRSAPVSGPTYVDATESGRRIRRGIRLWTVATSTFKAETYRQLRLERPTEAERAVGAVDPAGIVNLPQWVDDEWLKQLVGEQLVTIRNRRGFSRMEWQKLRDRNEALDCRVYARAAAWVAGVDRWSESQWKARLRRAAMPIPSRNEQQPPAQPRAPIRNPLLSGSNF